MKPTCMRCGKCCRNFFCIVPKNEDSNLSEEFLRKLEEKDGFEKTQQYVEDNSIPQGEKCKWLEQENYILGDNKNNVAKCTAYDRRCSMCRDYMSDQWCNLGLFVWKRHKENGNKIPDEIMEIIKHHPLYETYFLK